MDCELKGKTLLRGTAAVERRKKKYILTKCSSLSQKKHRSDAGIDPGVWDGFSLTEFFLLMLQLTLAHLISLFVFI